MRRPARTRPDWPRLRWPAAFASWRDRLAVLTALATLLSLVWAFVFAKDARFLMPGPLASAHGSIEKCGTCHTAAGGGKLTWVAGLFGDPVADSNACLACHKMPDTAFNAHGAAADVLKQSTARLAKTAAQTPAPQSARAQGLVFPADGMVAHGLHCATCHQEHQGASFKLNKISNEQCRSCHVVKFESFDGHHPEFESYPFKRRTRIIYDHAGHFAKHFPETAKKDPAKSVPATCASCHNSREDRRVMAVAPFEQTCAGCHLNQIVGKERVSGPKGIAFLTVPGLDLATLRKKRAAIGEWPEASEAELTPFMKVMISRSERGRALVRTVDSLNLQDLSGASDAQIRAVANLAWEIKRLFYALMTGKASDVLADLRIGGTAALSASLVADLTASIPRDVVIGAHQQWLPNLATEMANRQEAAGPAKGVRPAQTIPPAPPSAAPEAPRAVAAPPEAEAPKPAAATTRPEAGNRALSADEPGPPKARAADQTDDLLNPTQEELRGSARPARGAVKGYTAYAPDGGKEAALVSGQPRAATTGGERVAQAEGAARKSMPADERPANRAADQTDDLLNPTEEELRGSAAPVRGAGKGSPPEAASRRTDTPRPRPDSAPPADAPARANANAAPIAPDTPVARPQVRTAPVAGFRSAVDAESWAEYGGWYRQDHAIFYRPTGHKDKFITSWLLLTGPEAPKGQKTPAAAVFDSLTAKDAQGSCTKCHSVDDVGGRAARLVNFSPAKVDTKQGRFTSFIHEPHFGVVESRGCLSCHEIEKGRPYLQQYEQGNPKTFSSNFGAVKKELCQSCHTAGSARQDCLTCHKYHVNGVVTPIMSTKNPVP